MAAFVLAVTLSGVAHAGKAAKLNEEFVVQLDETVTLPGGLSVKCVGVTVEEIAASPDDPHSYPAGSGVDVSLELRLGTAPAERLELNLLSAGYQSKSSKVWKGHRVELIKTEDEHQKPKVTLRIAKDDGAKIRKLAAERGAPLAFVIKIVSITPTFPIDDMPSGYGVWDLKAQILDVVTGTLTDSGVIETKVELWFGPVLARPAALWVNEQPAAGSQWVVLATESKASAAKLLSARGDGVRAVLAR
ncbi:MAG: hypothetical protein QM817_41265 [Archangium sp.]